MLACGCRTPQGSDGEEDQTTSLGTRSKRRTGRNLLHSVFTLVTRCRRAGPQPTMPPAERAMKAAILIQAWYRRYLARMEIRRRYTWTIFQSIEYAGEQDQVKLYFFFNALLTHMSGTGAERWSSAITDGSSEPIVEVEASYKGIHVGDPLTRQDLDNLITTFRCKKYTYLHEKYVVSILTQATAALKNLPNLNTVSVAISRQITVVGDLHGKLDDLLVIFYKNGLPSAENPYIFNGDFVDRGKKGLEVLLILLSSLLVFPGGVHLNRGNHEDNIMNLRYGFIREVRKKYKNHADHLLTLIEGVYRWLPLGSLINKKVLVVHGGISDVTDINWIKKIKREKYVSILRPPLASESTEPGEIIDKLEWKQVFDILWSDPQASNGCIPNSLRGAGTYFGPDVTEKFLKKFNLLYLIRSHECKSSGYELTHSEKVITIFSASNYYEQGSNKGAYVKLVGQELKPHFVQFNAVASRAKKLTFRQRIGLVESSAMKELSGQIATKRDNLMQAFKSADKNNTGLISISEWCAAMERGTGLSLPWRMLRKTLVTTNTNVNMVEYMSTFQPRAGRSNTDLTVIDTLYRNKASLEAIFKIIDKDGSGYISREEFAEAITLLNKHLSEPITPETFTHLLLCMDIDRDGQINLNEFLEVFRLVDVKQQGETMEDGSSSEEEK